MRRNAIAVGLVLAAIAATPASAQTTPKPQIGPAYVYTHKHQEFSEGYCTGGTGGYIRFTAIKGVTSYTVVFNDGAYGGAEQRVAVAADAEGNWPQDHPEGSDTYPDLIPPKGEHQIGWTGGAYFGPGECQPDNTDYSTRMTNAHTEYYREGEYIDGTVTGPCLDDGSCPPTPGVKVTAKGSGGGSDTTDATGRYSIKVKKGDYTVTPRKGGTRFNPARKEVHVGAGKTATANFRAGGVSYDVDAALAQYPTAVVYSDDIRFSGTNWDPEGGPITVKHGDKVLERFKAAKNFEGSVRIPTFSKDNCKDSLTFNQDGLRQRFPYAGKVSQVVDYMRGKATADGERRLRKGDNVCDGERVKVDREATLVAHTAGVWTLDADDSAYLGARVDARWAQIEFKSISAPTITLGFEKGKPDVAVPPSPNVPVGSAFAESYDVDGQPGTVHVDDGRVVEGNLNANGYYRGDGSFTVTGDISVDRAFPAAGLNLFAVGDLTVGGRLFPHPGYIAATGALKFTGSGSNWESASLVASLTRIEIAG